MARIILALLLPLAGFAQSPPDDNFKAAGVCARCHVISVVEWGISKHQKASTGCTSCHGDSKAHVIDERNNAKPDRVPTGAAIAALCADCHKDGCPKSGRKAACQDCHHVHALVDPSKPVAAPARDERIEKLAARDREFSRLMGQGDGFLKAEQWKQALPVLKSALALKPYNLEAICKWKLCERRLKPGLPGFEAASPELDGTTGLPRSVQVAGTGIRMLLVPGGEFDMGSERFAAAQPVHTVRVREFYLGQYEVTQAEWQALMGSNPSACQGSRFPEAARMPVEQVSWEDAQAFVRKLNAKVEGGGFRLPTEAEWEFAARTGGAAPDTCSPGQRAPRPAGSGHPDSRGFYDLLGNVWEWCSSLDRAYPFDPADGRESATAPGLRILRGGGFTGPADELDPYMRHGERPTRRLRYNGLRLARDVPDPR